MSTVSRSSYTFREMQTGDLGAVLQIEPVIYSHPWTHGNFIDSLKAGHQAWVMMLNDEIIAYSVMMLVLDEAHLLNLSVAKSHQKKGLGRILLTYMVERACMLGAAHMFLEVRASNVSAIALYEKMGFIKSSVRIGYYPAKTGREDAVLMGLAIERDNK